MFTNWEPIRMPCSRPSSRRHCSSASRKQLHSRRHASLCRKYEQRRRYDLRCKVLSKIQPSAAHKECVKPRSVSMFVFVLLNRLQSGHDYTGRSTGPGALTIWTLHQKETTMIDDFTPHGCSASYQKVLAAGPGVNVQELYRWGAENAVVTIGGFVATVGAAGGYLLGGGLGMSRDC